MMNNADYMTTQQQVRAFAGLLRNMRLDEYLERLGHAEAIGPMVDPTLYRDALFSGKLSLIRGLVEALRDAQTAIRVTEGRYRIHEASLLASAHRDPSNDPPESRSYRELHQHRRALWGIALNDCPVCLAPVGTLCGDRESTAETHMGRLSNVPGHVLPSCTAIGEDKDHWCVMIAGHTDLHLGDDGSRWGDVEGVVVDPAAEDQAALAEVTGDDDA